MTAGARELDCACGLLWCEACAARVAEIRDQERDQEREDERQRARVLAATIDQVFERERCTALEARAIACGALALLAEATGLSVHQTIGTALSILLDVRAATDATRAISVAELVGGPLRSKPPPGGGS